MNAKIFLTYFRLPCIILVQGRNTSNVSPLTDSGAEINNRVQMFPRLPIAELK